jgi:hypothetical protein
MRISIEKSTAKRKKMKKVLDPRMTSEGTTGSEVNTGQYQLQSSEYLGSVKVGENLGYKQENAPER